MGDIDHEAGEVVGVVSQDQHPEGPLGAHADREGGDVLEAAREPHLPQRGLGAGQPLAELPGRAPAPPATRIGWSDGSACTTGT